jgi:hypothetical protein
MLQASWEQASCSVCGPAFYDGVLGTSDALHFRPSSLCGFIIVLHHQGLVAVPFVAP